ncbi:methyl-accepting chemotaxis protein [Pseudomonas sp. CrR25]|nr:methyl-accepting chemotaxis protein [Pseudomonas sp. CrR25]
MYLVNDEGFFLKHPDVAKTFGFDLRQAHRLQNGNPLLASKVAGAESLTEYQLAKAGQEARIHGFKKLHYAPQEPMKYWAVVSEVPVEEAFASVYALRRDFIVIGLLVVLLGAGVGVIWSRQFSKPLVAITERAIMLAAGEIVVRPIHRERNDEVGVLEESFNRMAIALQERANVAERIAAGDLTVEVRLQSDKDVLGMAYQRMLDNLRQLASSAQSVSLGNLTVNIAPSSDRDQLGLAFNGMLMSLKQVIQELNDGIAVLASSSEEVLNATSQVATNTQDTATAISEITTTVEEVKQTAVLAGSKSQTVAENAERTRQVAQGGRQAVEEALKGMEQIRAQMQAVAESIMHLGEQSQTIGEIVASVGDLAEQSNLLGVNASIEAMRAGESGRGFSVVAQEVKVLADQSKQATVQVRGILGEIQKAMTKAVLLAEQGSKAVEMGYGRAQSSGEAIRSLSRDVEASSEMALQIAATSQQQMVGMDQIATAMVSIRQASQDNAGGTRQMDQATRNLHELGLKLQGLANRFTL